MRLDVTTDRQRLIGQLQAASHRVEQERQHVAARDDVYNRAMLHDAIEERDRLLEGLWELAQG